jgi:hypothetical protein
MYKIVEKNSFFKGLIRSDKLEIRGLEEEGRGERYRQDSESVQMMMDGWAYTDHLPRIELNQAVAVCCWACP